ncbi:hypothetical protein U91I_03603 [alpha proteobacterium U9-1i]|nr:hypothetical protein U91I_03603 [alpha proteobacterium U9-1i]
MRFLFAAFASLALAQCAAANEAVVVTDAPPAAVETVTAPAAREASALVIIGVAESASMAEPAYSMLWRRVEPGAEAFPVWDDDQAFEARTSVRGTVRVRGIPGEFTFVETPPGTYALDSVFAELNERRISYFANGVVVGPERPTFEVAPGETVYLGIWQAHLDETNATATASLWRLDAADARAAVEASNRVRGQVRLRETRSVAIACTPRRMESGSRRQIC